MRKKYQKIAELLEIFLTTPDEVEEYAKMMQSNSSDNCVHHCNFEFLNFFDPELQLHDKKKIRRIAK